VLYGVTTLLSALGLLFIYANDAISALVIVALVPLCIVAVRFLGYGDVIRTDRRKNVLDDVISAADARNQEIQVLANQIAASEDAEMLWVRLGEAAELLGLETMTLTLDGGQPRTWVPATGDRTKNVHLAGFEDSSFELRIGRQQLGTWTTRRAVDSSIVGAHDRALLRIVADASTLALVAGRLDFQSDRTTA